MVDRARTPRGPRRVLMTADAVGGVWDYALELSAGLADAGVDVVLAVMGPPPDEAQTRRARQVPGLVLLVGDFRLEWMDDPWADVAAAGDWLLRLEADLGCDLVHLNGYAHGALPFRAPKLVVGHSCVLSWWQAVKGEAAPPSWTRYAEAVGAGLRAADFVVAPTDWMLGRLRHHYGPLAAARVISNGRDPRLFGPGEKKPFILCAGRLWDEAKNARALAEVAPRLPWPVKIAGAVHEAGGARAEGLGGAELLGRLPSWRLAELYASASIYALPARYEPFGLTALEAALGGCALVLGDIPTLREIWAGAAVFVAPDDREALASALTALASEPALVAELRTRAADRARQLGAAAMTESYLRLYQQLVRGAARRHPAPPLGSSPHVEETSTPCAS